MKNTAQILLILSLIFCAAAIEIAGQTCATVPSGLVAWYRAENNANDSSGNNNNGTAGAVTFAVGKVGQAFQSVSPAGQTVTVSDSASLDFTNAFTIEMWVSPSGVGQSNGTTFFACKGDCGSSNDQPYSILFDNGRAVYLRVGNSSTFDQLSSTSVLTLNTFSHVVGTYDGTIMRIYINGVLDNSKTTMTGTLVNSSGPLRIGGSAFGNTPGIYDEFSLYNRALTDAEILAIFNAGSAGKCFAPTAASVQISGRVKLAKGKGIFRAQVSMTDVTGVEQITFTNQFGYYQFADVAAGKTYIFSVTKRGYQFADNPRVLFAGEDLTDADFKASLGNLVKEDNLFFIRLPFFDLFD